MFTFSQRLLLISFFAIGAVNIASAKDIDRSKSIGYAEVSAIKGIALGIGLGDIHLKVSLVPATAQVHRLPKRHFSPLVLVHIITYCAPRVRLSRWVRDLTLDQVQPQRVQLTLKAADPSTFD